MHFFVEVCRRPGKPVNFVPVIDADVRRWWRSDSLWQAHDESYGADQVIAIPGPVSVGGITVKDEPVADLLDRFEAAIVETLSGLGVSPIAATSRSTVGAGTTPLDAASVSPDVVWAGRVVPNPLHRLEGVPFTLVPEGDEAAVLEVPLSRGALRLRLDLSGVASGRLPVISEESAAEATGALLALTAGGTLPEVDDAGTAVVHATWSPDLVADHIGVTSPARTRRGDAVADPQEQAVPDALVGLAWPAVFACIGPVEGLLDLVHLDHRITVGTLPDRTLRPSLTIAATRAGVVDTTAGQVISVEVRIYFADARMASRTSPGSSNASWSAAARGPRNSPTRPRSPSRPRTPPAPGSTGSP